MTIKIEIKCDGLRCCNSVEITDTHDADIEHAGYHTDPVYGEYHYCKSCWPKIKAEIENKELPWDEQQS